MNLNFKILARSKKSKARAGEFKTAHGKVLTPTFVPVGTQASVKSLTSQDLKEIGVQIFFGNTYHLHLRPGEDVIKKFGGLGKFMGWDGVTITDSGGFQVFSLARGGARRLPHVADDARFNLNKNPRETRSLNERLFRQSTKKSMVISTAFSSSASGQSPRSTPDLVKINDDGVKFRSHLDGSLHVFTPEKSIEIQQKLGADIILAFDDCPPYPFTHENIKKSLKRTHEWAVRSLKKAKSDKKQEKSQALFGIVQGGVYKDLREESAKFISSNGFDGIAIGGVAVGEGKKEMRNVLDWTIPYLPEDKVRHLLGVGEVDDIFDAVEKGVDMFDCVIATRLGRVGFVFVSPDEGNIKNRFRIDIQKSKWQTSKFSLDKNCQCYVCQNFTRGYISHLFRAKELLAYRLATYHNVYFITNLTKQIRESILNDNFERLKKEWLG